LIKHPRSYRGIVPGVILAVDCPVVNVSVSRDGAHGGKGDAEGGLEPHFDRMLLRNEAQKLWRY
jgi:hypothetical protein